MNFNRNDEEFHDCPGLALMKHIVNNPYHYQEEGAVSYRPFERLEINQIVIFLRYDF